MKIILFLSCILLIAIAVIALPLSIKVRVVCNSQFGECPATILEKLNSLNGKNLINAKNGVKKYLKTDFSVSDYSTQFKIPNILEVEILVKKAVIAFKNNASDLVILADAEGKILSVVDNSVLPLIVMDGNLPGVGQNLENADLFALNLARGLNQMYQINTFTITDASLLVELPGQIRVIFPLEGDKNSLLGSLRLIYSKIQEDGNLAGYSQIDLRYRNPVLR